MTSKEFKQQINKILDEYIEGHADEVHALELEVSDLENELNSYIVMT